MEAFDENRYVSPATGPCALPHTHRQVVRQISMLFIDNKDSVFCILFVGVPPPPPQKKNNNNNNNKIIINNNNNNLCLSAYWRLPMPLPPTPNPLQPPAHAPLPPSPSAPSRDWRAGGLEGRQLGSPCKPDCLVVSNHTKMTPNVCTVCCFISLYLFLFF